MADKRNLRAGTLYVSKNGTRLECAGSFTVNLGVPKKEAMTDQAGNTIGYKETAQTPSIEGEIFDARTLNLKEFFASEDETITLQEANGKIFVLRNAWYAGEGSLQTEEAKVPVRFEGKTMEEIR
jgi:hypothetical protein